LPQSKDIAQAFLKEAEADLRSARLLLVGEEYSQTIGFRLSVTETDARDALDKAEYVHRTVMTFLRQRYGL
jgi:HEPN domain-containing protein